MGKLSTPIWIKEGFDSKEAYEKKKGIKKKEKGKTFKIRICPNCGSDKVFVVLNGEEGKATGEWECKNCRWKGRNVHEKELTEDEFMKYLDAQGAEVI